MPYRNGTYVAFHARGTSDPTESDIKYFNLLKAWHVRDESDFEFVNSHDKGAAVRDSSRRERLRNVLSERLRNSKNMILIIGQTTRFDTDWIPFEIAYAIDNCNLPIIAAYPDYQYITQPALLSPLWPLALETRIRSGSARVIHIPFKQEPLIDAMRFDYDNPPETGLNFYTLETYMRWGIAAQR
jgi:hypothetical protein